MRWDNLFCPQWFKIQSMYPDVCTFKQLTKQVHSLILHMPADNKDILEFRILHTLFLGIYSLFLHHCRIGKHRRGLPLDRLALVLYSSNLISNHQTFSCSACNVELQNKFRVTDIRLAEKNV